MATRYNLSLDDRLATLLRDKADERFMSEQDFIRTVLIDHLQERCGAAGESWRGAGGGSEPRAAKAEPSRPPGRPVTIGNKIAELLNMKDAELTRYLHEVGYFPVNEIMREDDKGNILCDYVIETWPSGIRGSTAYYKNERTGLRVDEGYCNLQQVPAIIKELQKRKLLK